jgi:hypothetical protein
MHAWHEDPSQPVVQLKGGGTRTYEICDGFPGIQRITDRGADHQIRGRIYRVPRHEADRDHAGYACLITAVREAKRRATNRALEEQGQDVEYRRVCTIVRTLQDQPC